MKVVAILHRSAGNDTVGDMWKETAIFELDTPIKKILEWAVGQNINCDSIEGFKSCLEITVAKNPELLKEEFE